MNNEFQDIYLDGVHPMPSSAQRLTFNTSIIYANPWVGLASGGPITLNASEFLVGGVSAYFSSGANVVTWPDVTDIASELGMSSVTGYALDYFVANNSQQDLEFVLGAGMVVSTVPGANNLIIPPQSAGSFRFVGFDGGWNGQDLQMLVARVS
jgi:hypothetical protein